jgi:uncharacterized membrane protein YqaE (UPF0057 family)
MAARGAFSTSSRAAAGRLLEAAAAWLLEMFFPPLAELRLLEAAAAWLLEVLFPPLAGLLQHGC